MTDKILYAHEGATHVYKLCGRITHAISAGFDASISRIFDDNAVATVCVDLTDAVYLDSTNLGLLARIAREMSRRGLGTPTLVCPSDEIFMVIDSMGFATVFEIRREAIAALQGLSELQAQVLSVEEKGELLLSTHRELMEMNEKNFGEFRGVVSALEQELGCRKG